MRFVALILALTVLAVANAAAVGIVPVSPRYPVTTTANTTYAVPSYLGVQIFTGTSASAWTLPLSYNNGGPVANGQVLVIRNIGSAAVTAAATSPDTIHGGSVTVAAAAAAQLVMVNGQWLILSVGATLA